MHKVRRNNVFLVSCRGVTYKDWVNLLTNLTSFLFSLDRQSEQLFWWRYDSQKKNSGSVGRQQAKKIAKGLRVPSSASHGKTTLSIYKSHSILKPKGRLLQKLSAKQAFDDNSLLSIFFPNLMYVLYHELLFFFWLPVPFLTIILCIMCYLYARQCTKYLYMHQLI